MPDENVILPPVGEVIEPTVNIEDNVGAGFWGATPPAATPDNNTPPATPPATPPDTPPATPPVDEIAVPIDWLKKEFEIEDPAILKAEREELKKLKETPPTPAEIKFENDESKQIYEVLATGTPENKKKVREYLQAQKQIEELTAIEVNNDTAESIIKLQMKLKNKQLTDKEIDFEYRQSFVPSKEPVQRTMEEDTDFAERMDEWKEQCEIKEQKRIIAAKLAQPELNNFKSEIVLPQITPKETQTAPKELSQEDLAKFKLEQDSFINSVETGLKSLNELSITVKDEAVEIPVSYTYSPEEKAKLSEQFKSFAENGFDANALLAPRWVNEDGTLNVLRMMQDMARLNSDGKIDNKLANDSAAQRLREYTKEKKHIHLPGATPTPNGQLTPANAAEEVEAAIWNR